MASVFGFAASPLPRTLSKPYKPLIPDNSIPPQKASHFKNPSSSPISSSPSEKRAFPVAPDEIQRDFASGTAFLSSILAVLVWILESRRNQRLLLPRRTISRRRRDLRRGNVMVGSWKLSLDVLPSIRDSYESPAAVIDPAFLGSARAAEWMTFRAQESDEQSAVVNDAARLGAVESEKRVASGFPVSSEQVAVAADPRSPGIVKSADPEGAEIQESYQHTAIAPDPPVSGIVKSIDHPAFGICESDVHPGVAVVPALLGIVSLADLISFGSSDCRNCRALVPVVDVSLKQLVDSFGPGRVGLDESDGSKSVRSVLMLPVGRASDVETPLYGGVSVTKEDKLHAQRELKAVVPAIVMTAGAFGAVTGGVNGGMEMIGFVAVISFLVQDLLWASNRRMLWEDLLKVTDREKFVLFLKARNILTTD